MTSSTMDLPHGILSSLIMGTTWIITHPKMHPFFAKARQAESDTQVILGAMDDVKTPAIFKAIEHALETCRDVTPQEVDQLLDIVIPFVESHLY
jgi:hypothetical protein